MYPRSRSVFAASSTRLRRRRPSPRRAPADVGGAQIGWYQVIAIPQYAMPHAGSFAATASKARRDSSYPKECSSATARVNSACDPAGRRSGIGPCRATPFRRGSASGPPGRTRTHPLTTARRGRRKTAQGRELSDHGTYRSDEPRRNPCGTGIACAYGWAVWQDLALDQAGHGRVISLESSAAGSLLLAAAALAGILDAVGGDRSPAVAQSPAPAVATPAPRLQTLDLNAMDATAQACTDFYQYADGGWLEQNPIPRRPAALGHVRRAAPAQPWTTCARSSSGSPPTSRPRSRLRRAEARRLLRRLHGRGGDRVRRASADRSRSSARSTRSRTCRRCGPRSGACSRWASTSLFAFGSEEDRKDSSQVIAAALQGGLGLPERDYYLEDGREVRGAAREVRRARREDARARRRSRPTKAAADAKTILALETKLAKASQNNVDFRDPDKTSPPDDARGVLEGRRRTSRGRPTSRSRTFPGGVTINVWQPRLLQGGQRAADVRAARDWKTYLRWHLLSAAAPTSRSKFVDEDFAFNGKTLVRDARDPAALEALRHRDGRRDGDGARPHLRQGALPARGQEAARDELVKNLLARARRRHQDARLDERGDEEGRGARRSRRSPPKIGYPDEVARLFDARVVRGAYAAQRRSRRTSSSGGGISRRSASRSTGRTGA